MYLESILKEVHSVDGSEYIVLEALNYLALNIYFNKEQPMEIESPMGRTSARLHPSKIQSDDFMSGGFDKD